MIARTLERRPRALAREFPVVTITGPRQSGKTTICRAVFDRGLEPGDWYPAHVAAYLERDGRTLLRVRDLVASQALLRLCAGRVGQLLNLSSPGGDAGVAHGTVRFRLSVLETGYVAWRLPPLHANLSRRLVKRPKLHFLDTGLVCWLLGIRTPDQLRDHPRRGSIFETWVASEIPKARVHRGLAPNLAFYRDRKGTEVDVVVELGRSLLAVETKSGETIAGDFFTGLDAFVAAASGADARRTVKRFLAYGGTQARRRTNATVVPWSAMNRATWWEAGA